MKSKVNTCENAMTGRYESTVETDMIDMTESNEIITYRSHDNTGESELTDKNDSIHI